MCAYVHVCTCVCHVCRCLHSPEGGIRFPGSGDTGYFEGPHVGMESELHPLEEQQELLAAKPTLQALGSFVYPSYSKADV